MRILEVTAAGALCVLDVETCHLVAAVCELARGTFTDSDRRAAAGALTAAFDVAALLLEVETAEVSPANYPAQPVPPQDATLHGIAGALRAQAELLTAMCTPPLGGTYVNSIVEQRWSFSFNMYADLTLREIRICLIVQAVASY